MRHKGAPAGASRRNMFSSLLRVRLVKRSSVPGTASVPCLQTTVCGCNLGTAAASSCSWGSCHEEEQKSKTLMRKEFKGKIPGFWGSCYMAGPILEPPTPFSVPRLSKPFFLWLLLLTASPFKIIPNEIIYLPPPAFLNYAWGGWTLPLWLHYL